jgi:hypothetical protein
MIEIDPQTVKYGFDALRAAVETVKLLRDTAKAGGRPVSTSNLDEQIKAAERQVQLAEAQLAQSLNYRLCKVHFPPVPMLKNRVDAKRVIEIHKCPICGDEDPSPEFFADADCKDGLVLAARSKRRNELYG